MKRKWKLLSLAIALMIVAIFVYVHSNPLVFNESFWDHAHCIKIAAIALNDYAAKHNGRFPAHSKGYGNALILLPENFYFALTGPGYDPNAFYAAKQSGGGLSEEMCGRVYIQGLTTKSYPLIVVLFDKIPTPGGDHCHFIRRLFAPVGREVLYVDGSSEFIVESNWPTFRKDQVSLLVKEGFERNEVERLFGL